MKEGVFNWCSIERLSLMHSRSARVRKAEYILGTFPDFHFLMPLSLQKIHHIFGLERSTKNTSIKVLVGHGWMVHYSMCGISGKYEFLMLVVVVVVFGGIKQFI